MVGMKTRTLKVLWAVLLLGALAGCGGPVNDPAVTKSHLQQLGLVTMLYAQKNNETYPDLSSVATSQAQLRPFLKAADAEEKVFANSLGEPFQPNPWMSKKTLALENLASIVLFYEATSTDGARGVIFADGQYKSISDAEWPAVKQTSGIP